MRARVPASQPRNARHAVRRGRGVTAQRWAGGTGCLRNLVTLNVVGLELMAGQSTAAQPTTDSSVSEV